jgi:hypothetical protein
LESVFQLIFHYTTKHQKIIHFSGIYLKKTTFQQTNGAMKICKDKNNYYHNFKIQLGGRFVAKPGLLVEARIMGRINPNQHKNKSVYYQSFKTLFGD